MWGEICQVGNTQLYDELTKEQIFDICDLMEQAQQPNCLSNLNISSLHREHREITIPAMDPRMLYTAVLHRTTRTMNNIIDDSLLALEYNLSMPVCDPNLSLPKRLKKRKPIIQRNLLNYIEKVPSNFSMGVGKNPPTITDTARKHAERQCLATLLGYIGFEDADDSLINILVDVLESFFIKICKELKNAHDSTLIEEPKNFPDIMEQVLLQSGIGGIQGIHDYYEQRVKKYLKVTENRSRETNSQYKSLCIPNNTLPCFKIEKIENTFEDEDIPEVHFTTMEGEESLQPFLAGFQMLNSLEQESQFIS